MDILFIGNEKTLTYYTHDDPVIGAQNIVCVPIDASDDACVQAQPGAEVIIADAIAEVRGSLMERLPALKMVHSNGVGFNRIDLAAASRMGIYVCNCAGMNASAVAEQTVLLMLGVLKNAPANDRAVREGRQIIVKEGYMAAGTLMELSDCRIGLVGFGNIGRATAKLLKAFNTDTVYYKRSRLGKEEEAAYGARYLPLDELLKTSDIVSLHLPMNKENEGMCGKDFLGRMKEGSFLINTSRGELVDEAALAEALKSGHIAMAGLDTLCNEPVQKDAFLLSQPEEVTGRLFLSPHIGGITKSSFKRAYRMLAENITRLTNGEKPENIVNGA